MWAAAAVVVAVARAAASFEHGWWLVAFFGLVGAASQLALGTGQAALVAHGRVPRAASRVVLVETALWNAGCVLVPLGVLVDAPAVVAAGSGVLLLALAAFAATAARSRGRAGRWQIGYPLLVVALTVSVFIGAGLAEALPWQ